MKGSLSEGGKIALKQALDPGLAFEAVVGRQVAS